MSEPGNAAEFENSQPAPQSVRASPVKIRKQLPQRSVDEFWKKVRTAHVAHIPSSSFASSSLQNSLARYTAFCQLISTPKPRPPKTLRVS